MANCSNEFEFIINEDGSITRKKYTPIEHPTYQGEYTTRPTIMKFYCSSDHMTCGEEVKVFWAIQDTDEVSVTISQGEYSTTEAMPVEGELLLTSNISSDDITIMITARNSSGIISSRKTIALSKRLNTVQTNVGATVVYVIIIILVLLKLILIFL
jgi:hypothetical protein